MKYASGLIILAVVVVHSVWGNMLDNPGFETAGSSPEKAEKWEQVSGYSQGDSWGTAIREEWRPHNGDWAGAILGEWSGGTSGGVWQEKPAEPGAEYEASGHFWADSTWSPGSHELSCAFYDDASNRLDGASTSLDGVSESWESYSVTATAPQGAARVRVSIKATDTGAEGALQFDDLALRITRRPPESKDAAVSHEQSGKNSELDAWLEEVAADLLKLDFASAQRKIAEAEKDRAVGTDAQWPAAKKLTGQVAAMPDLILESFRRDIGKEVTVYLRQGPERLQIKELNGRRVMAKQIIRIGGRLAGSATRSISLSDMRVREKIHRLGDSGSEDHEVMRGLLAWEIKKPDMAISYFERSDSRLGNTLVARIRNLQAERKAAARARRKAAKESAAAKEYKALLETAGFTPGDQDKDKLVLSIRKKRFNLEEVEAIKKGRDAFLREHGQTDLAGAQSPVLDVMRRIRPNMPLYVDREKLDRAMKQLDKDNPSAKVRHEVRVEGDSIVMDLSRNEIVDISALAGLPIKSLDLSTTKVGSINALRGMPLEWLKLHDTEVRDISPLVDAPLEWLDISQTLVGDNLEPLENLQNLKHLNLRWMKPQVRNLSSLRGLELEYLGLTGSQVSSLEPIYGMPIRELDAEIEHTRLTRQEVDRFWESVNRKKGED